MNSRLSPQHSLVRFYNTNFTLHDCICTLLYFTHKLMNMKTPRCIPAADAILNSTESERENRKLSFELNMVLYASGKTKHFKEAYKLYMLLICKYTKLNTVLWLFCNVCFENTSK